MPDSSSQRPRRANAVAEARAPRELVAEVVGLVGDDERPRRALRAHARRPTLRDARVGDGDAVEVPRRAQLGARRARGAGRGGRRPAPTGASAAPSGRRRRRGRSTALRSSSQRELDRRPRLARAGRGVEQERPPSHASPARASARSCQPRGRSRSGGGGMRGGHEGGQSVADTERRKDANRRSRRDREPQWRKWRRRVKTIAIAGRVGGRDDVGDRAPSRRAG